MQFFKGDEKELKYYEAARPLLQNLESERDSFYDNAFTNFALGDVIWDSGRSPLSRSIARDIFRESFPELFELFLEAGSVEGYISIFKKIFGDTVSVLFAIPSPGKLEIDIVASGVVLKDLIARYIVGDDYFFDELIDHEG